MTVRSIFNELCSENDNVTEIYSQFVEANEQAVEKIIPTKKRKILEIKDAALEEARMRMYKAFPTYSNDPSDVIQKKIFMTQRENYKLV